MRTFGIMYQFMMCSCRDNALYWFDRADSGKPGGGAGDVPPHPAQKLRLQMLLGKAEEMVEQQKQELAECPEQADSWVLLVVADMYAQHYEEAYDLVQQAMERFPEEWELTIHACNIARHLEKYPRLSAMLTAPLPCARHMWTECMKNPGAMRKWESTGRQDDCAWRLPRP